MLSPQFSEDDCSLVIRTDFSSESAWELICQEIQQPQTEDQFSALVECISDPQCAGLSVEALKSLLPKDSFRPFVFVVDPHSCVCVDHSVLVVDLLSDSFQTFRVITSEAWSVENNLRLANMDFDEFVDECDEDGVFRGFSN